MARPALRETWPGTVIRAIPAALLLGAGVAVWQAAATVWDVPAWLLPSPAAVGRAIAANARPLFLEHSPATLGEAVLGLAIAGSAGIILGSLLQRVGWLRQAVYPLLVLSQTVPVIVLAPLLVIWLGFGAAPKLVVVGLACFFPIAVNTADGLAQADSDMVRLVRSMGAGEGRIFRLVRFPAALPALFSGLRVAASYAVMAAVIAEWMGAEKGLGLYIVRSAHSYRTAEVFAGIFLVSVYSILFFGAVRALQRAVIRWDTGG